MAWARIDDGFHDHPKVDSLSLSAVGLWTLCLSHAHRHRKTALVPGHIAEARVKKLAGRQAHTLVTELLTAGLWEAETGLGGWVIHDFADYLPKQRDPDEAAEAGKRGAASRWKDKAKPVANSHNEASNQLAEGMASDGSRASAPAFPSRPVPSQGDSLRGERKETLRPVAATKPLQDWTTPSEARCTAHVGVADPGPCNGCRKAREKAEQDLARDAEQQRREDQARALACERCDGTNVVDPQTKAPTRRKCDHRRTA